MMMHTRFFFAVLVPHRDCLPALRAYRRSLFTAGLAGAHSFPLVSPLALVERPLGPVELKPAAAELRAAMEDKKFCAGESLENMAEEAAAFPGGLFRFFGLRLELPFLPFPALLKNWEKPFLAPAILAPEEKAAAEAAGISPPALSFRAAALANLCLESAGGGFDPAYSFTWNRGPLFWLPNPRKKRFLQQETPHG
ncbi:MAG: hypothetical protein LBD31_02580 [Treponema sp.]|nr:hypothetical protein [Treponema sp.]